MASSTEASEPTMYAKQMGNVPSIGYTAQVRRPGDVYESDARLDRSHSAAAIDTASIQDAHWRRCEGQQSWPLMSWSLPSQGDPEHEDVEVNGYKVSLRSMPMGERQQAAPGRTADEFMMYKNWNTARVERRQVEDDIVPEYDQDEGIQSARHGMTAKMVQQQQSYKVDAPPVDMTEFAETGSSTALQLRKHVTKITELYHAGKHIGVYASNAEGHSGAVQKHQEDNRMKQAELPQVPIGNGEGNTTANVKAENDRPIASEVIPIVNVEGFGNVSARHSGAEEPRRLEEVSNHGQREQSNESDHGRNKSSSDTPVWAEIKNQPAPGNSATHEGGFMPKKTDKVSTDDVLKSIKLIEGLTIAGRQQSKSDLSLYDEIKQTVRSSELANDPRAPQGEPDKVAKFAEILHRATTAQETPANEPRVGNQSNGPIPISYANVIAGATQTGQDGKNHSLTTVEQGSADGTVRPEPPPTGAHQPSKAATLSQTHRPTQVVDKRFFADALSAVEMSTTSVQSDRFASDSVANQASLQPE